MRQILEFPAADRYVVVASHDCDFTEAKRDHFLLARLQEFNRRLDAEAREAIKAANDAIRVEEGADERYEYIDTFVLDPLPGSFDEFMPVQFTTISPWHSSLVEEFQKLKRAELEHEHRVRLRKKLAFFFGREAADIADEEKFNARI